MQQTQLMLSLETHTQALNNLTTLTQRHKDTTSTAHAAFLATSDQTKTLLTAAAADISYLRNYVDQISTSTTSTTEPANTPPSPPPTHGEVQNQTSPASPINELDVEYPDGPTRPTRGECFLCHEYSDDLKICGTCELPFDEQCILLIHHRETNQDEFQCNSCRGRHQPLTACEGLTELSDEEKSHETTTTSATSGQTQPDSGNKTPYDTIQTSTKPLRPRAGRMLRSKPARTTPPKTRNSTNSLGNIPPAPNE
jgi:hypothetical protein